MNHAKITKLTGSVGSGGGYVDWLIPDGGSSTTDEIELFGGVYQLLCSITFDLADITDDLFFAEWSLAELHPQRYEYHTREHLHAFVSNPILPNGDTGTGPRLIYQNPLQWWSGGIVEPGTLQLEFSHPVDVVLIAMRMSHFADLETMGLELK